MKADKIALSVLGGIATGAILGILFAPAKGKETREKILEKGGNYAGEFKDKFGNILETLNDKYEQMYQNGENLLANGKSKFEDNKKELKNMTI